MNVTAIFFSCRRLDLLSKTVDAFIRANTYPIYELIIVNDSGNSEIHNQLRKQYPTYTLALHEENVGLMKSIDLGYKYIDTEYFFHCEDDWMCTGKGGFIEQSLDIMTSRPDIEEVWLDDYNNHPLDEKAYFVNGFYYKLASENCDDWHGFSTACGLKRKSDYLRVGPYVDIDRGPTIWHHERNIGLKYHALGYRTAVLLDRYAINIGHGQSEYKTGLEK